MKKAIHKATSFLMALVVLFSTMSFTISSHYCGETLVATSLFRNVESCGMEKAMATLPSGCSLSKPDCCKNEEIAMKGQDELKITFDKISLDQQIFVAAFIHTYVNLFPSIEDAKPSLKAYPPPLIVRQLFKLDETYLI